MISHYLGIINIDIEPEHFLQVPQPRQKSRRNRNRPRPRLPPNTVLRIRPTKNPAWTTAPGQDLDCERLQLVPCPTFHANDDLDSDDLDDDLDDDLNTDNNDDDDDFYIYVDPEPESFFDFFRLPSFLRPTPAPEPTATKVPEVSFISAFSFAMASPSPLT